VPRFETVAQLADTVARRHHTVPRFYLEGFSTAGRIVTVELPGDRRFTSSTKDASVWTGFYDLPGHPDGSDAFEKALSKIEDAAAAVFRQIVEEKVWPLAPADRQVLAEFVTVQVLRGPNERQRMEEIVATITQAEYTMGGRDYTRGKLEEEIGRPLADNEFERLWGHASTRRSIHQAHAAGPHRPAPETASRAPRLPRWQALDTVPLHTSMSTHRRYPVDGDPRWGRRLERRRADDGEGVDPSPHPQTRALHG